MIQMAATSISKSQNEIKVERFEARFSSSIDSEHIPMATIVYNNMLLVDEWTSGKGYSLADKFLGLVETWSREPAKQDRILSRT